MGRRPSYERSEVLNQAGKTFARLGYAGTSIDDLVTATGVHRGSLYREFGSKRELFLESVRHHIDAELGALARTLEAATSTSALTTAISRAEPLDLVIVAAVELGDDARDLLREAFRTIGSAMAGSGVTTSTSSAETNALAVVACRIAARCLPTRDLPDHIKHLIARP